MLHEAIQTNRQISFKYCEWTEKKELRQKRDGADYIVSPWSLTWDDENYYLVAYEESSSHIKHYRVDKMQEMKIIEENRLGRDMFDDFDLAAFAKKTFGMYGGQDTDVTLLCENSLAGVIIDRFGQDTFMVPVGENQFRAHVTVAVSRQFFGWLTGIGEKIEIVEPESVRVEYREYLGRVMWRYE